LFSSLNNKIDYFHNRDFVIIGAGIDSSTTIPNSNLIVADGALRACLERKIIPEIIVTDLDGYVSDVLYAHSKGSKIVLHAHGDNLSFLHQYYSQINPICVTSTYPSENTFCWGGFTDGDRALMMSLSLGALRIGLLGFNFEKVGLYSGRYSPRKLKKLKWAEKIISKCMEQYDNISYI